MCKTSITGAGFLCALALLATASCGGSVAEATDPGDVDPTGASSDAVADDGIIRDADGDGEADEANVRCEDLTETKCKITAGCSWTTDGNCTEGGGSPM